MAEGHHHRNLISMRTFPIFLAVYALLYAAFGVQSPFLPALLHERGLRAEEIGIVLAASTAIRVLAGPAVGHAADRLRMHVFTLCACALAAAVASLGYVAIRGFDGLLIVGLVHAAMLAPIVPISDALSTTAARRSEAGQNKRFEYGWLRASGSAAFIAGTVLSGWGADRTSLTSIIWISGSFLVAGGIASLMLPGLGGSRTEPSRIRTSALHDWALLLRLAVFRRIILIAALIEGSHALNDTFAVIRWHAAGVDLTTISVLWSESVLSEILVFLWLGPRLLLRVSAGGACALAAGAGIIRWSILACTTSPILLAVVQPLHGVTFALLHLACMRVIVLVVPLRLAATAQSIYGTLCIGLTTALLTLASGVLYERLGGSAFFVMAALCVLALPMCAGLRSSQLQASSR
jgi:MFS transporter, PPP family, 3-phenylpropionic acid transporter